MLDDLEALRIQLEWGVDECLLDAPLDRFATVTTVAPPRVPAPRTAARPAMAAADLARQVAAAAPDLRALHAAMDAFDACALRHTASTTVAPSGDAAAGLVLIGEAPGPDDDRAGEAFSGAAGAAMDRVLGSAGFSRADLLLALMVPWRPPGGRAVNESELAACLPFLHRMLVMVRPRRIVLMGAGPHRAFAAGGSTLRKDRGTWASIAIPGLEPLPALTMLAPDAWMSSPVNKQATWTDMLNLRAAVNNAA